MRPVVAVSVALLALLPAAAGLGLAELAPRLDDAQRMRLDVTGWADQTVALDMAAAPLPQDAVGIGPGSLLFITMDGSEYLCTANWIWEDRGIHYLGAAGHCFLPGCPPSSLDCEEKTATHGPGADYDASDVVVRVCIERCHFGGQLGFTLVGVTVPLGEVAYARQTRDGDDIGNDFGVVRIPEALEPLMRRDIPVWGRPTASGALHTGDVTCHYGHAAGFGELWPTKPRLGVSLLVANDGSWRAVVPSFQGDSGSAVARCIPTPEGPRAQLAVGLLTHLSNTGVAGTTMPRAIELAAEAGLSLAPSL